MTQGGVNELYLWLTAAWPLVIKPGASDEWQRAKKRELYQTYKEYTDKEVQAAFQKWTEENEKFPTTRAIINELKWTQVKKSTAGRENEERWPMCWLDRDGNEWSYGNFVRAEFLNHPRNPEHLQPEEWERRFNVTRCRWYKEHLPELTPAQKYWADHVTAFIRQRYEEARSNNEDLHKRTYNRNNKLCAAL